MNHVQKRGSAQNIFWSFSKWNKKSSLIIRLSNQNYAIRIISDYPHYELLSLLTTWDSDNIISLRSVIIFDKHQFAFSIIRNSYEQYFNESRWRIFSKVLRHIHEKFSTSTARRERKKQAKYFDPFQIKTK